MADLPGAVHLVAEAPVFHNVRLPAPVGDAHVGVLRAGRRVAVFDEVGGVLNAAGAHVDGQHGFASDVAAEVDEFVGAEPVAFNGLPCQVAPRRPLLARADAVLPAVAAEEVAAGVAHAAEVELAQGRQHVAAQALLVGARRAGVVNAAINAAAHVLGEAAEEQGRDRADDAPGVDVDAGGFTAGHGASFRNMGPAGDYDTGCKGCPCRRSGP